MNKNIKVFYLYGSIGIGKTIYAKWLFRDIHFDDIKFVKGKKYYWIANGDTEYALYDNFFDCDVPYKEFINLIDNKINPIYIKGKGKKFQNNYKYIIITSIQNPSTLWISLQKSGKINSMQWLEKMCVINMDVYYKENPGALEKYIKDIGIEKKDENKENLNYLSNK